MVRFKNMVGVKCGLLTVLKRAPNDGTRAMWVCRCECGTVKTIPGGDLRNKTKSCGCWRVERLRTHGESHTRPYWVWTAMLQRCKNPNDRFYRRYGGRGIKVCKRWHSYEAFRNDMGPKPRGAMLDRIDNDGDYTPSNCRWVSAAESIRNSTRVHNLTHNGKTQCIQAWHEETGIPYRTILARLRYGWDVDRTLTQPVAKQGRE